MARNAKDRGIGGREEGRWIYHGYALAVIIFFWPAMKRAVVTRVTDLLRAREDHALLQLLARMHARAARMRV